MFNILVDYPSQADELEIVLRTTSDEEAHLETTISGDKLLELAHVVRRIAITPALALVATQIARMTRPADEHANERVRRCVRWGAGPRASQYIVLGAKARAAMQGSPVVRREDISAVALPVLRHRMKLNFQAEAEGITVDQVVNEILGQVDSTLEHIGSREQIAKVLRS
jgi:MoxR-like ATPase